MADLPPDVVVPRTRAENATFIIEKVRALGLEPAPTSRLMQMHRVLNSGHIESEDPRFPTAREAECDLQQPGFVFDQLESHRDDQEFKTLIWKALKDSVLPQNDQKQSIGRDSQFHLYLSAVCQNAGFERITFEEPDLSCDIDGEKFGIAAKRIENLDRLEERVKKGADQVRRSKMRGIVALELSLALNPKNMPIVSRLHSQVYPAICAVPAWQLFDEHREDIYRWVRDHGVFAVHVFEFRVRLRPDNQWGLDGMSMWLDTTENDREVKRAFNLFYSRFLSGMPNRKDFGDGLKPD